MHAIKTRNNQYDDNDRERSDLPVTAACLTDKPELNTVRSPACVFVKKYCVCTQIDKQRRLISNYVVAVC
jgi:hypothetical protein